MSENENKSTNGYTLEELLEAAKNGDNSSNNHKKSEIKIHHLYDKMNAVERFISVVGIKKGKNRLPAHAIYDFYTAWAAKSVTNEYFYRIFEQYFVKYTKDRYSFYLVNKRPWEIKVLALEHPETDINIMRGKLV